MKWIRRSDYAIEKPLGWSFYFTKGKTAMRETGFRFGIYGGTLYIPASDLALPNYDFKEWFFRIPISGVHLVLCRIREEKNPRRPVSDA